MEVSELIGIEYKLGGRKLPQLDCWGLCVVFYKEILSLSLPSYDDADLKDYSVHFTNADVLEQLVEVDEAQYGDLITFNIHGKPRHVGVALDNKRMIHTGLTTRSCVENFKELRWKKRIHRIYRHISR